MHDLKSIRDNPQAFDAALARRGAAPIAERVLALDTARRAAQTAAQEALAQRNALAKAIGQAMARGDHAAADAMKAEAAAIMPAPGEDDGALDALLAGVPNLPAADVPDGADEHDNVVSHVRGMPVAGTRPDHADFAASIGIDFESAQRVAGARFAYLRGPAARLARALGQFMLDTATSAHGYAEVAPPLLVRDTALFGTGQLPKLADDMFRTTDDRWLIPTAEVSLTNLVADQIVSEAELPLRFAALTPCFRAEAGAAGRDTRGLIRQHQFDKCELVAIVTPENARAEHEAMTAAAEVILDALELSYRRMLLCAGDLGFSARKTYDLEVWLPGQQAYREISSVSDCGDFQARRMKARYRPTGEKGTRFVHTLNGSALAVGRALVAVLETYRDEGGAIAVPVVLQRYLHGETRLAPIA